MVAAQERQGSFARAAFAALGKGGPVYNREGLDERLDGDRVCRMLLGQLQESLRELPLSRLELLAFLGGLGLRHIVGPVLLLLQQRLVLRRRSRRLVLGRRLGPRRAHAEEQQENWFPD